MYAHREGPAPLPILLAPPAALTLEALARIAAGERVVLGDGVRARCEASHRQLLALAASGRVVYGLNTGCGPLCERPVPRTSGTAAAMAGW